MDGIMAVISKSTVFARALRNSWRLPACAVLVAVGASSAAAESTCVLCNGPEAAYECNAYANDPIPDTALALFCTSRIADDYGHKSCSVEKNDSTCMGLPVHFPYNPDDSDGFGFKFEPVEEGAVKTESETLGELASETYDASKETVKQTGEAIGTASLKTGNALMSAGESISNATNNTLKCIQSSFSDC
jgi:hypothetical protein